MFIYNSLIMQCIVAECVLNFYISHKNLFIMAVLCEILHSPYIILYIIYERKENHYGKQ